MRFCCGSGNDTSLETVAQTSGCRKLKFTGRTLYEKYNLLGEQA